MRRAKDQDERGRRHLCAIASAVSGAVLITACGSSGAPDPTPAHTRTATVTTTPSSGPIVAGPTTAAAGTCTVFGKQAAADDLGMRLAKVRVLESGGKVVGCEFYAIQNSPLATSERLPGPKQPVLRITADTYPGPVAAHNAMVRLAEAGSNPQQVTIEPGNIGLAFQTDFYPKDHGTDWACAFTKGPKLIVIRTVVTSPALNAIEIAKAVAGKL